MGQRVIDGAISEGKYQNVKTKSQSLSQASWPYGVSIELFGNGVLLKPKPKPRQAWAKAFRQTLAGDETAPLRNVKNKFDHQEWEW